MTSIIDNRKMIQQEVESVVMVTMTSRDSFLYVSYIIVHRIVLDWQSHTRFTSFVSFPGAEYYSVTGISTEKVVRGKSRVAQC